MVTKVGKMVGNGKGIQSYLNYNELFNFVNNVLMTELRLVDYLSMMRCCG